jgi:hypothetical protein
LYEACAAFLRFATSFVGSTQNSFGSYNQVEDSVTFPLIGVGDYSTVMPDFEPAEGLGDMQDELQPMSAFLGSYLGENMAMNGHWNLDFSQAGTF